MKIIATIGPSTTDKRVLKALLNCGVTVLRFNFSHVNIKEFNSILKEARKINKDIHIMQDLSGSKIRVSSKLQYILKIYNNEEVLFCGENEYDSLKLAQNTKKVIPLNIDSNELLTNKIEKISMKDNTMQFNVLAKTEQGIKAEVVTGGVVRCGKGCNIKKYNRTQKELSKNDKLALKWGVNNSVDYICQSFVEQSEDINNLNSYIKSINYKEDYYPKILAKIESEKGVYNIETILEGVDGIVIGRGDMVPEVSLIQTPIMQRKIIKNTVAKGKDIIIATHLLDSMKEGRTPNLPEVESIYYHIKEGVSGFLLAGETSIGRTPIKSAEFLKEIIDKYSN